jgi:ketosteroid isomerase-like protein
MTHQSASIAMAWLDAFNHQHLDRLLALYAENCRHTSPQIRLLHPDTGGMLVGKDALRSWWQDAFKRLPGLRYEMTALTAQADRAVLEYRRLATGEAALPVSESFDIAGGLIVASRVYRG